MGEKYGDAWSQAFPCGPGQLALTVCGEEQTPLRDVAYATVGVVFERPIPLQPKRNARYSFSVGTATIDLTARGGTWTLTGSTEARALIRNNVVFVMVPMAEARTGAYRVATSVGGQHDTQPPASEPPLPLQTTIVAEGTPGHETAAQFAAALSAALTSSDGSFLTPRLHPAVVDRYGAAACTAFAAGPHAATNLTPKSIGPPAVFTWQSDGLSRDIADTNTVTATDNGQDLSLHIALVDGTWRWFTDCGSPAPGAR